MGVVTASLTPPCTLRQTCREGFIKPDEKPDMDVCACPWYLVLVALWLIYSVICDSLQITNEIVALKTFSQS